MVLGMRYGFSFNYAMAGLYRAAVAVSALIISLSVSSVHAADPPVPRGNVSVNVNPTTGYYSTSNTTLRLPDGVRATTSAGLPVVTKYPNGLQQTIPTSVTIDAIKKSAPLPVAVRASTSSLKRAASGCLRSARCNIPLILAGEGLSSLFDGLDWVMGEGGKIQKNNSYGPSPDYVHAAGACLSFGPCTQSAYSVFAGKYVDGRDVWCQPSFVGLPLTGQAAGYCHYGGTPSISGGPVSDSEIVNAVDSDYVPEPSDWPALTPELELDDVEITSAPTLQGEPRTTTVFDAEGNPHKVTETNIWYDFDIRDNPSPRPALDMKTREETKTYEDGVLTGTTTTNSSASAGSNDTPPPPESLIDCDLFPTACAWFDWTQEEPTEPDDDLSGLLQEVPIVSETYTITGGVAACPAPMVLDLSVFGSREVSYQPLCDLASTMKYLYLALMSFAAAVLLNRSVNRV